MKPSQRIKQIIVNSYFGDGIELPNAIMDYLDEEWEKKQPKCEHLWIEGGGTYKQICRLCDIKF